MKYLTEFREKSSVDKLIEQINSLAYARYVIMEVCGGQTHSILKFGLNEMLPDSIELIHGPGCPVCVTSEDIIDMAVDLALKKDVILCSFGDMLRVPGTDLSLEKARANGANIKIVYSPLDCLEIAKNNPDVEIVFLAVGFETTAPANALAVCQAHALNIRNFSLLVSHVLVPPAIEAILTMSNNRVQGFLAAGHVCAVTGYADYYRICSKYKVPIVITGFEPVDILSGILMCITQLNAGHFTVENQYSRVVVEHGNAIAKKLVQEVFENADIKWRGLGVIPNSGLAFAHKYKHYDAMSKFSLKSRCETKFNACISAEILTGQKKPPQCPNFATGCNPENPLGAPMVSSEGACNAYYQYAKLEVID